MIVIASVTVMAHIYTEKILKNDWLPKRIDFIFNWCRNIIGYLY